jgi:hypothetical protein
MLRIWAVARFTWKLLSAVFGKPVSRVRGRQGPALSGPGCKRRRPEGQCRSFWDERVLYRPPAPLASHVTITAGIADRTQTGYARSPNAV